MTLEGDYPAGPGTSLRVRGAARDLVTPVRGEPEVVAWARLTAWVDPDRTVRSLVTEPSRPGLAALVGVPGGGNLRALAARAIPAERAAGTSLYQLVDDLAVLTLISWYAYSQWLPEGQLPLMAPPVLQRGMVDVCHGLRQGSSALSPQGFPKVSKRTLAVGPLADEADSWGWHPMSEDTPRVSMRRARRIDVYRTQADGGGSPSQRLVADSMFQDSMTTPAGRRRAVHEYQVYAEAGDLPGGGAEGAVQAGTALLSVQAQARVVPYRDCPHVVDGIAGLIGTPMTQLRRTVLTTLGGVRGCTHLNDALRALAEVPALAAHLPG